EKLGYNMREAQIKKVTYLAVLCKNEEAEGTVSYRLHGEQGTTTVKFDEFVELIVNEIKTKGRK
ncbi:MAG: threonine--tRNA ligase, partial [Pseudobutyrivibrio sp.]|nr:threonine--tRNA ligase [Pseudobutyrivibrio sp.]